MNPCYSTKDLKKRKPTKVGFSFCFRKLKQKRGNLFGLGEAFLLYLIIRIISINMSKKQIYVAIDIGSNTVRAVQEYLLNGWTIVAMVPILTNSTIGPYTDSIHYVFEKEEIEVKEHKEFRDMREDF